MTQARLIKPRRLSPGATVGVVAPAGRVDSNDLQQGIVYLERMGFKVILGRHIEKAYRYFAGKDQERAEDLSSMLSNQEVAAVLCARGGFGSARILPYLDLARLSISPKIFVGSSDITTLLHFLSKKLSWVTFHGPMVATQFGKNPTVSMEKNFLQILSGEAVEMRFPGVTALRSGAAEGVLTGGCLTLLCATVGTDYEIETEGKILFLEDTDEPPFRIDRMLTYLKAIKKFDSVEGVVFGQMPRCQPELLSEIIMDILADFRFPILFGFPSGHGDGTATLPFGVSVRLDGGVCSLRMVESAVF